MRTEEALNSCILFSALNYFFCIVGPLLIGVFLLILNLSLLRLSKPYLLLVLLCHFWSIRSCLYEEGSVEDSSSLILVIPLPMTRRNN